MIKINFYEVVGFDERRDIFRGRFFDYTRVILPRHRARELFRMFRGNPSPAAITYDGIQANESEVESEAERADIIDLMLDRNPMRRNIDYLI